MNRNILSSTLVAMSLAAVPAFAQGDHERMDPGHGPEMQPSPARHNHSPDDERGAGPDHRFHQGDRLPAEYRNHNYVVDDWREHRLSAPPRGYQWVQTGSDYVLVAIASGIIAQLLLDH